MNCLFCKIARGEIPSEKVYEDDIIMAFKDINPIAPVHVLVIPKEHIESAAKVEFRHKELFGHIFCVVPIIMASLGVTEGFRVVTNSGEHGGQTVNHIHFHILAGRELAWPPG